MNFQHIQLDSYTKHVIPKIMKDVSDSTVVTPQVKSLS